tara:strand:- start:235 stop:435 length:201 start_codon:yes stop_codon:yes gene_type:complete
MSPRLILPLILLVALGTFALQNTTVLKVSFLFWSFQISQALLIVLCGAVGIVLGLFFSLSRKLKKK